MREQGAASTRVRVHECGHAGAAERLGFHPTFVTVLREGAVAGHCRWDPRADSPWDHYAHAVILFAGPQAERQLVGTPADLLREGMEEDVKAAVPHLEAFMAASGLSAQDVVLSVNATASRLVTQDAVAIGTLADVLARVPVLEGARLTAFLRELEIRPATRTCPECGRECPCAAAREARDRILARQAGGAA